MLLIFQPYCTLIVYRKGKGRRKNRTRLKWFSFIYLAAHLWLRTWVEVKTVAIMVLFDTTHPKHIGKFASLILFWPHYVLVKIETSFLQPVMLFVSLLNLRDDTNNNLGKDLLFKQPFLWSVSEMANLPLDLLLYFLILCFLGFHSIQPLAF